jgi:hypothetical protein
VDDLLSTLRRRAVADPGDDAARFRFRLACVRDGRTDLAGIQPGDIVWVEEVESPWVYGPWRGEVLKVFEAGDKYVRPLEPSLVYRVRPSPEYLARGLYLTRQDKTTLIEPASVPTEPRLAA